MLRAMLRDMRAHLGRVAMTLVAVVLGVGFVVATWVVSDSAAATVVSGSVRHDVAVVVTGEERSLAAAATELRAEMRGLEKVSTVVFGYSALVQSDGKLGDTYFPDQGATNWDGSERFALADGRGPVRAGEVALEEEVAQAAGYGVGDRVRMLAKDGSSEEAEVVGVFTYRKAGARELTPAVAYDHETALARFDPRWIELYGADQESLGAQAKSVLGEGYEIRTAADLEREREREANEEADLVRNFLLAFAGVALLVGMFVIANTFTMLVAQRTRHLALLRAVGAKRRQVRRAVLAEAGVLGLVGATIGAALGVGLAWLAMRIIPAAGETVIFAVSPAAIIVGYLVGLVVTVTAAYGSARRGAAVPPVAALGTDYALPRRSLVARTVLGVVALATGTTAVVATSATDISDGERVVGMGGALLAWLGVILLAPLLASAVLVPLSRLAGRYGSTVSRLAVRNAIRDPRRTAATASALMIGLALVTAFATVGESTSSSLTSVVRATIPSDTLIVQGAQPWFDPPEDVMARAAQVPGVTGMTAVTHAPAKIAHEGEVKGAGITMVRADAVGTVLTPPVIRGSSDLSAGVMVSEGAVRRHGLDVGDTVTIRAESGDEVTRRVVGVYGESLIFNGIVVDEAAMPGVVADYHDGIYLTGPDPDALHKALDAAFADRPDVLVHDRDGLIAQLTAPVKLALGIISALLGAAVVIAVFGVVNTLALSVLERTREIGVFRAVGASRTLVRRSVRRESVVIAMFGGMLGVGVGVLLGGVMQHILLSTPIFGLAVPVPVVLGALGGMVVVGVLAALWPARRAARTDVLAAIATA